MMAQALLRKQVGRQLTAANARAFSVVPKSKAAGDASVNDDNILPVSCFVSSHALLRHNFLPTSYSFIC